MTGQPCILPTRCLLFNSNGLPISAPYLLITGSLLPVMNDAVCPSKEAFERLLHDSYSQWSSHLKNANASSLPSCCLVLKRIVGRTPSFLGSSLLSEEAKVAFACVEKKLGDEPCGLLASGQSVWAVSGERCHPDPKIMPLNILLAVRNPVAVELSDSTPLANWPGAEGLSGFDEGNYLTILFLAWAYVLSARLVESLAYSPEHRCTKTYKSRGCQASLEHNQQQKIELDLGSDISAEEASWWNTLLSPGGG